MAKTTSCGIIITDNFDMLICLPTHNTKWDIPKGRQDDGETYAQTAIRETFEETGLVIDSNDIQPLGIFKYKTNKDLYLFKCVVNEMPEASSLSCESFFVDDEGEYAEMEKFAVVSINQAIKMVNSNLSRILIHIFDSINAIAE